MEFVKKYRGMPKVCNWCKKAPEPSIRWKWVADEHVWYRWYDGKWHFWGVSKHGFTHEGWTWYKGYWHHSGYVYRYHKGHWWRFQGGRWVVFSKKLPLNPGIPRGPKICRPFYLQKKYGFPASLSSRKLPRCQVGTGKNAVIFMWKNHANCKFVGGRLVYKTRAICKVGKPHTWKRVTRCVQGNVISGKGLNYKTGKGHTTNSTKTKTIVHKHSVTSVSGMKLGSCYKFKAYSHNNLDPDLFMSNVKGVGYNSPEMGKYEELPRKWKVVKGMAGFRNTITI